MRWSSFGVITVDMECAGDGGEQIMGALRPFLDRVTDPLLDAVPDDYRRVDLRLRALGDAHDAELAVIMGDGSTRAADIPPVVFDAMPELRKQMHAPEHGSWLSIRLMLDPTKRHAHLNFDYEPQWRTTPAPEAWERELELFPRDSPPGWMRAYLGQEVPEEYPASMTVPPLSQLTHDESALEPREAAFVMGRMSGLVTHFAPSDWSAVQITYRAVGDHVEMPVMVFPASDGEPYPWEPPEPVAWMLAVVRAGMYRLGRGAWFQCTARVQPNTAVDYEFSWDAEPGWDAEPPETALVRELVRFPRDEGRIPGWFRRRLDGPAIATFGGAEYVSEKDQEALRAAERAAAELEAEPSRLSVGEVRDGAWCLAPDGGRWAVGWAEGGRIQEPVSFGTATEAARYFAGHLYLHRDEFRDTTAWEARRDASEWPVQPLGGDLSLNHYKGKRLVGLPPGTEIDRYGEPDGNTCFVAGTRFPNRTQPAEHEALPYRVYRLRRTLRVLTGTTVPWYDQPGGGTVFLLPRPISDLIAEGALEEIPERTVPLAGGDDRTATEIST